MLRAGQCFAKSSSCKLLFDASACSLEPYVIPSIAKHSGCGVAYLPHSFEQPRLTKFLQQLVERGGEINRRFCVRRSLNNVQQRQASASYQDCFLFWLVGDPGVLRSHRRGHWFDPSIAHE